MQPQAGAQNAWLGKCLALPLLSEEGTKPLSGSVGTMTRLQPGPGSVPLLLAQCWWAASVLALCSGHMPGFVPRSL